MYHKTRNELYVSVRCCSWRKFICIVNYIENFVLRRWAREFLHIYSSPFDIGVWWGQNTSAKCLKMVHRVWRFRFDIFDGHDHTGQPSISRTEWKAARSGETDLGDHRVRNGDLTTSFHNNYEVELAVRAWLWISTETKSLN